MIDLSRLANVEIIDPERHLVRIGGGATWGQVAAARPALEAIWARLAPHVSGAYANFLSAATAADVAAIYPPGVYNRLAAVKRQYDPGNLFARNHNIRPQQDAAGTGQVNGPEVHSGQVAAAGQCLGSSDLTGWGCRRRACTAACVQLPGPLAVGRQIGPGVARLGVGQGLLVPVRVARSGEAEHRPLPGRGPLDDLEPV